MKFIDNIKERVRKNLKTIVLPETSDIRTIEAARKITDEGFANIILVGEKDAIYSLAKDNNIYISDIKVIDPKNYEKTEELINNFYELRKKKNISMEDARNTILNNYLYFGCMLVKLGLADGQVSGAINSTADTLRPALQILKTAPNTKIASSFFLMDVPNCNYGASGVFVYSDCGPKSNK